MHWGLYKIHCVLYNLQYKFFFLNAFQIVQTAIHLKKFILGDYTTYNVKNVKKKVITDCTNDNMF